MPDQTFVPLDGMESARDLAQDEQADCILAVLYSAILRCPDADPVQRAASTAQSRQELRECIESLCRPLTQADTQHLFELTILELYRRLAVSHPQGSDVT